MCVCVGIPSNVGSTHRKIIRLFVAATRLFMTNILSNLASVTSNCKQHHIATFFCSICAGNIWTEFVPLYLYVSKYSQSDVHTRTRTFILPNNDNNKYKIHCTKCSLLFVANNFSVLVSFVCFVLFDVRSTCLYERWLMRTRTHGSSHREEDAQFKIDIWVTSFYFIFSSSFISRARPRRTRVSFCLALAFIVFDFAFSLSTSWRTDVAGFITVTNVCYLCASPKGILRLVFEACRPLNLSLSSRTIGLSACCKHFDSNT